MAPVVPPGFGTWQANTTISGGADRLLPLFVDFEPVKQLARQRIATVALDRFRIENFIH
jgi:hypothetical protein